MPLPRGSGPAQTPKDTVRRYRTGGVSLGETRCPVAHPRLVLVRGSSHPGPGNLTATGSHISPPTPEIQSSGLIFCFINGPKF